MGVAAIGVCDPPLAGFIVATGVTTHRINDSCLRLVVRLGVLAGDVPVTADLVAVVGVYAMGPAPPVVPLADLRRCGTSGETLVRHVGVGIRTWGVRTDR